MPIPVHSQSPSSQLQSLYLAAFSKALSPQPSRFGPFEAWQGLGEENIRHHTTQCNPIETLPGVLWSVERANRKRFTRTGRDFHFEMNVRIGV